MDERDRKQEVITSLESLNNRLLQILVDAGCGTSGQEVDGHERPILRSANDIRKWFMDIRPGQKVAL